MSLIERILTSFSGTDRGSAEPPGLIQTSTGDIILIRPNGSRVTLPGSGAALTLAQVLANGNDANGLKIVDLLDPTAAQDAATKQYVDTHGGGGGGGNQLFSQYVQISGDYTAVVGDLIEVDASSLTVTLPNATQNEIIGMFFPSAQTAISVVGPSNVGGLGTFFPSGIDGSFVFFICQESTQDWLVLIETPLTLSQVLAAGNDANATQIKGLSDPSDGQDATTMTWVEGAIAAAVGVGVEYGLISGTTGAPVSLPGDGSWVQVAFDTVDVPQSWLAIGVANGIQVGAGVYLMVIEVQGTGADSSVPDAGSWGMILSTADGFFPSGSVGEHTVALSGSASFTAFTSQGSPSDWFLTVSQTTTGGGRALVAWRVAIFKVA